MTSLFVKTFATIALSGALTVAALGTAQAVPVGAAPVEGALSGSGDSGSSLAPLLTVPLGALYIVLCDAEPNGPVCALIYEIGSGSSESE
ncbi:hypothetical protein ACIA5E_16975 [Nocardia asteroides]|uniref:hypothetical protein n=1 Tax=Nocardia asteroides TaxID=1824 RepID=UPI0037B248B7